MYLGTRQLQAADRRSRETEVESEARLEKNPLQAADILTNALKRPRRRKRRVLKKSHSNRQSTSGSKCRQTMIP